MSNTSVVVLYCKDSGNLDFKGLSARNPSPSAIIHGLDNNRVLLLCDLCKKNSFKIEEKLKPKELLNEKREAIESVLFMLTQLAGVLEEGIERVDLPLSFSKVYVFVDESGKIVVTSDKLKSRVSGVSYCFGTENKIKEFFIKECGEDMKILEDGESPYMDTKFNELISKLNDYLGIVGHKFSVITKPVYKD